MEPQLNPQAVIDELVKRIQALTLENVVLSARLAAATSQSTPEEVTIIGDATEE
jgi:hypothetical protein